MGYIRNKVFVTDTDMVRNKNTPYKIIIPKEPNDAEQRAADELKFFFEKSTGINLMVCCDENIAYDVTAYYFSIGKTILYKTLEGDSRFLNEPFYPHGDVMRLYTKGNMLFFAGNGYGPVLAVYEFLERCFGYKYYAKDEWTIEEKSLLKVPVVDIEYHPAIPRRALGFYDTDNRDMEYVHRLKLNNTLYTGWIENSHTYFKLLPKEIYFDKHPDWYSPDGKNLCLSNIEMKKEFVERVKARIEESTDNLFMLGQEDTFEFCSCPACREKIASYNGRASGFAMEFTNEIAKEVGEWIKETHPERASMKFVAFAYNETFAPPAVYDEYKGKYVAMNDAVKAEDNVAVMLVPYNALYSSTYLNEKDNPQIKEGLLGWQAVSKDIMIWSYCTVYCNYMVPFNNLATIEENYRALCNIGTSFYYDAASYNGYVPCFEEMRQYVQAALMWGRQNVPALIKEFCKAYYGEAAPCMEYVIEMQKARAYYNEGVHQKYYGYSFDSFNELMDRKLFSKEYLMALEEAFNKARELVRNSPREAVLLHRIEKEYIDVLYFRLKLYPETFENYDEVKKQFQTMMEKHKIRYNESNASHLAI